MDEEVYVIEVNPRSSRTVPYISKVTGIPIVDLATRSHHWQDHQRNLVMSRDLQPEADYYCHQDAGILL